MTNEFGITLLDMLLLYTQLAGELDNNLKLHHQRTAYVAYRIARRRGLPEQELERVLHTALIHDIGIITAHNEKIEWLSFDLNDYGYHGKVGGFLTAQSEVLRPFSRIISHHHVKWIERAQMSHLPEIEQEIQQILHIADRMTTLIADNRAIAFQREDILNKMAAASGTMFKPELVDILMEVESKEAFWLELEQGDLFDYLKYHDLHFLHPLTNDEIMDVARTIVYAVDYRQTYTAAHSIATAELAGILAEKMDVSPHDLLITRFGMLLHDIGKIKIDSHIFNNPKELTREEFELVQSHPFIGRKLINDALHLPEVAKLIAHHHERLDGSGYPFNLQGHQLKLLDRIGAIADMTCAMMEDRPYRQGCDQECVLAEIRSQAYSRKLDMAVYKVLEDNIDEIFPKIKDTIGGTFGTYRKLLEIMMTGDM